MKWGGFGKQWSAFHEEQYKCDIIISRVDDQGNDQGFFTDLCQEMDFLVKSNGLLLMRKRGDHPHLMKVAFPTAFDAHSFIVWYEEGHEDGTEDLPSLHLHPGRTREELAAFAKTSKDVFKLM